MTNCPHPFATRWLSSSNIHSCLSSGYFGPLSCLGPFVCVCVWKRESWLVCELHPTSQAVALSFCFFWIEISHLERHDMRCHVKILWHVTFLATTLDYFAWVHLVCSMGSMEWCSDHPAFPSLEAFLFILPQQFSGNVFGWYSFFEDWCVVFNKVFTEKESFPY